MRNSELHRLSVQWELTIALQRPAKFHRRITTRKLKRSETISMAYMLTAAHMNWAAGPQEATAVAQIKHTRSSGKALPEKKDTEDGLRAQDGLVRLTYKNEKLFMCAPNR